MVSRSITVQNRLGLHARPASMIVMEAQEFVSEVWIEMDDVKIDAKSIMSILTLGAGYGTILTVCSEGPDEKEAVKSIVGLFENKFKES